MLYIDYATNVVEKAIRHRGDASDAATRALNTRTPWPMHFDVWVGPWDANQNRGTAAVRCATFSASGVPQWLSRWAHDPKILGAKPRSANNCIAARRAHANCVSFPVQLREH